MTATIIKPTVGRVVWFFPSSQTGNSGFAEPAQGEPLAAIIARVWSDNMVNLTVFDANGVAHSRTSVKLMQEGEILPEHGFYCTWMPYQKGQAAKTGALDSEAAKWKEAYENMRDWALSNGLDINCYNNGRPAPDSGLVDFGDALRAIKAGKRVAREGWNGKGMWLALSPGVVSLPAEKFWAGPNRDHAEQRGGYATVLPTITMKTATGEILMGWLASQTDMLAGDWMILD